VLSVDAVEEQAANLAQQGPGLERIEELADGRPLLRIDGLVAGYGKMEILHAINLQVAAGQSLCLIGPNGAGKSTVLHSIYGFTNIFGGSILLDGQDVTKLSPNQKLSKAGIAYVLQDNSVFPDMTVEENLWMGGYLQNDPDQAKQAAERVFQKYERLARRRQQPARVLSGGERRLLEISRALVMDPKVLLIDEPSIGLEPRYIDMVFEILADLQQVEGRAILMVEQNAKKGLEFADVGYVLVSGSIAMADSGDRLLQHPDVGRLFLGG
jgi:branched-chain amino acid transport system ATP-binding protein